MDVRDEILGDQDFRRLRSWKNTVSYVLTVLTMVVYFGFLFLIAFRKDLLARELTKNVTFGIVFGLGVIVISFVFTGVYVWWANNKYDVLVSKVKEKIGD
ncbi:MAG TPA: DUF485 domain-containing protein [Dissulfurispiraceae bacterium]|nr:DUF485 domain-containing protein [Dissulfurispiraceae bacterium]